MGLSKNAVRKAGSTLRAFARGEVSTSEAESALAVVQEYRESFSQPLAIVVQELTKIVHTLGITAEISQRVKRVSTIYDKLTQRETTLDLSRMRDIGGCRAVVHDGIPTDLYSILDTARHVWEGSLIKVIDYVQSPRSSGYRAIHLEVKQDGHLIEVQLRTQRMHEWAQTAEALSYLFNTNYKQDGRSLVQEYMKSLSWFMQASEDGIPLSIGEYGKLKTLEEQVFARICDTMKEQS